MKRQGQVCVAALAYSILLVPENQWSGHAFPITNLRGFAVSEVDRYFSNPAQALGYLLGYRKIRDLRARAEKSLGGRFDVKDFHAVLIDNGSMPLAVLEKIVDEWIARGGGANKP